ncbi:MAG: 50S ribosomal protein L25 [Nitrospina sp.]|jgi:large subunit ribosomal protein L25|nr:50S ribosomal protein L25 [Nitrospina sp.]MBT6717808.1 50S ribosomal protein L25 [Nitrospina sp.]
MSALTGKLRVANGKSAARKLRSDECIPAVVYGLNDNVSLSVNPKELKKLIDDKGRNVLIELKVDGDSAENRNVVLQEFQTHPLKPGWVHIDFLEIDVTKKIKAKIPVILIGISPGEKQGGHVNHIIRALEIESLPKDIPEKLEVDMSGVELNQMIHVSDLNVDGSVTIVNDSHDVVVNVHLEKVKEEKAEGEEGAEGAEGEAAAAPAEDAGKKEDGKN